MTSADQLKRETTTTKSSCLSLISVILIISERMKLSLPSECRIYWTLLVKKARIDKNCMMIGTWLKYTFLFSCLLSSRSVVYFRILSSIQQNYECFAIQCRGHDCLFRSTQEAGGDVTTCTTGGDNVCYVNIRRTLPDKGVFGHISISWRIYFAPVLFRGSITSLGVNSSYFSVGSTLKGRICCFETNSSLL